METDKLQNTEESQWLPLREVLGMVGWLRMNDFFWDQWQSGRFIQIGELPPPSSFDLVRIRAEYVSAEEDRKNVIAGISDNWRVEITLPENYWENKNEPRKWKVFPSINRKDLERFITNIIEENLENHQASGFNGGHHLWTDIEVLAWIATQNPDLVQKVRGLELEPSRQCYFRILAFQYLCWKIESRANPSIWPSHLWNDGGKCPTIESAFENFRNWVRRGTIVASRQTESGRDTISHGAFDDALIAIHAGYFQICGDFTALFDAAQVKAVNQFGEDLRSTRAPSVKKGRPPADEVIKNKIRELRESGYSSSQAQKGIKKIAGFENVTSEDYKRCARGMFSRGRPKKEIKT